MILNIAITCLFWGTSPSLALAKGDQRLILKISDLHNGRDGFGSNDETGFPVYKQSPYEGKLICVEGIVASVEAGWCPIGRMDLKGGVKNPTFSIVTIYEKYPYPLLEIFSMGPPPLSARSIDQSDGKLVGHIRKIEKDDMVKVCGKYVERNPAGCYYGENQIVLPEFVVVRESKGPTK